MDYSLSLVGQWLIKPRSFVQYFILSGKLSLVKPLYFSHLIYLVFNIGHFQNKACSRIWPSQNRSFWKQPWNLHLIQSRLWFDLRISTTKQCLHQMPLIQDLWTIQRCHQTLEKKFWVFLLRQTCIKMKISYRKHRDCKIASYISFL